MVNFCFSFPVKRFRHTCGFTCVVAYIGFALQVSDHLDIGRDETDESKVASLSAIHAVGDPLFVKVRYSCCVPTVLESLGLGDACAARSRLIR